MAVVIPSAVQTARDAYVAAQAGLVPALDGFERTKAALEAAQRTADPDAIAAAQANLDGATLNLFGARRALGDAGTALNTAIGTWLQGTTPQTDIARLSAAIPIVFFPVRLETRFDRTTAPGVLKVRIYPDDIFFDTHETELTREEVTAAKTYYDTLGKDVGLLHAEQPLWDHITRTMSPERATYVLRVMAPTRDGDGNVVSYPDPTLAPSTWNRPGEAILPDRWVAVAYRAGQVPLVTVALNKVQEPLTLTVDPNTDPANAVDVPGSGGLFKIDQRIAWTVDYDRAVDAGMAITINLRSTAEATDVTGGFDRLVVFGVKTSMPPDEVGRHLEKLLDNHHFTRGVGLVRQGTPTNNTDEAPTPLPRDGGSRDTLIEERAYVSFTNPDGSASVTGRGGDVEILGRFLGLADGVFPNLPVDLGDGNPVFNIDRLGGFEQARAFAMNRVTWPVLFGYVVENMLTGTGITHDAGRDYFKNWVRARGPAPAFRIGMVPYGVLPVVSLAKWAPLTGLTDAVQNATMIDTLKRMREQWKRAAAGVDRVKQTSTDPLADLLKALALYPSAREVRVREMLGPTLLYNLAQLAGIDYQVVANSVATRVASALNSIGRSSWASALMMQIIGNQLSSQVVTDFVAPPETLSEVDPLRKTAPNNRNWIEQISTFVNAVPFISIGPLVNDTVTFEGFEKTLLYKVVRHAYVREAARLAAITIGQTAPTEQPRLGDLELVGIRGATPAATTAVIVPTYGQLLLRTDLRANSSIPYGDFIRLQPGFQEMNGQLHVLQITPSAELDRLFPETLDLASHRLDAWITSLATTRLTALRAAQGGESPQYPLPSHFGAYAMVEDIRPTSAVVPNGGFIHGPSMAHASAAAVLRSGHLTYRSEDPQKYAIDLSSERVRAARVTLDAVRSGQPLGAILGQRFERRLADRNPAANQYRYALRRYFPLVAGKETPLAPGETADVVAARNVVDGLAMWTAFKANQIPFSTAPDLPSPTSTVPAVRQANADITAEIAALSEPIDGIADLVISESVYHLVRGATGTAAGQMDALARGSSPPDPEMGRSARGGTGVTERVAFVFPDGGVVDQQPWSAAWAQREVPPTPPGPPPPKTPRALAEPLLDAWAAGLLGDPKTVSCAVDLKDAAGAITTKVVRLAQLSFDASGGAKLWPLDVLSLARADSTNQGSLLERFIASAALRNEPSRVVDRIVYTRQGSDRTFPEIMALALAIVELLAGARAMEPGDLAIPAETEKRREEVETGAQGPADALLTRAKTAHDALAGIRDDLAAATAGGVLAPLEAAAAYVPSARPAPGATAADLAQSQGPILAEIDRRIAAHDAVADPGTDAASKVAAATERLRSLFGRELLPLAGFPPPADDELKASFDARQDLLGGTDGTPIVKFLQRAGQVQPGLARWRTLSLYLGALSGLRARLDAAQLPFAAGERWAALPFVGTAQPRGRVAFTLMSHETASPSTTVAWRGFVLDEWVETVPQPTEQTGVSFHYDSPIAEAGQAILLAVPSSTAGTWSYDDILATLNETMDLAKIRAVDNERLELGHFLPTAYMTRTLRGSTVNTSWPGLLRALTTGSGS
jgi:hypothetical protein